MKTESTTDDRQFRERLHHLDALLHESDAQPDPAGRARTREIVQVLMEFHGAAVERMLEHLLSSSDAGQPLIDALAEDELISSLLLLYGLHPLENTCSLIAHLGSYP